MTCIAHPGVDDTDAMKRENLRLEMERRNLKQLKSLQAVEELSNEGEPDDKGSEGDEAYTPEANEGSGKAQSNGRGSSRASKDKGAGKQKGPKVSENCRHSFSSIH
jgi:hypothetical protein